MEDHPNDEKSYAYNGIPSSHIIGETKLVVEGMESLLHELEDSEFEHRWQKCNQNESINSAEAVIEYMARFTDNEEWIDDNQTNKDYLKMLIGKEGHSHNSPFDHSTVTVMFNNASMLMVKNLLSYRLNHMVISDRNSPVMKMGFWLPPAIETNVNYTGVFAQVFANINDLKIKFFETMDLANSDNDEIRKKIADVSRLYPWGTQVLCGITAGMGIWRKLFDICGQFEADEELRFVFLHLAYKFKNRYPNAFQDMVLENKSGEHFGFNTVISSLEAWKDYKIHFKTVKD